MKFISENKISEELVNSFNEEMTLELAKRLEEDNLFPEPSELRGLMTQLEALLELIEGNSKIQSNSEAA